MNTKPGTSDKDTPPPITPVELSADEGDAAEALTFALECHLDTCAPKASIVDSGHFGIEEPLIPTAPVKYSCTHCGSEIAHVYGQLKGMRE